MNNNNSAQKHTITFDVHLSRWQFFQYALKFILASILGVKSVLFVGAGCDRVTSNGEEVE